MEQHSRLNYLDITVHKTPTNVKISIYRKLTFTNTLIPYTSNHPVHHKYAAIRFLYNRLNSFHLLNEEYQHEENILHNNSYPLFPHKHNILNRNKPRKPLENRHRWTMFTYIGKETTYITNLFRQSNIQLSYRTNSTLLNHLSLNTQVPHKFSLSGVYKLTCPDCKKAYIGQTDKSFITRYNEHKRLFRNNSHTSNFTQHLIKNMHSFGNIHDIMHILHIHNKGHHLNTLEQFHIHIEAASNNHLNDDHTISPNGIFDSIIKNLPNANQTYPLPTYLSTPPVHQSILLTSS